MNKFINSPDLGLLVFRLFIGLSMAFAHGLSKVPPSSMFIDGVAGMGFPLPTLFAWGAGLSELLGGLLIAVGLFTRPAALSLGVTMAIAAFVAHAADPFERKEMALLYLVACVLLCFQGAGRFSLDRIFRKK